VIDTHVHFIDPRRVHYPWLADPVLTPINRPFLPDDLAPVLETNGVRAAILVQTRSSLEESKEFLAHAQAHPWLGGVVAWANLTATDFGAQLEALRAAPGGNKLVGIRHQVQDEPDDHWLLRQDVQHGLAVLDDHDLTFDLLVKPQQLEAAIQTVRWFPSLTFVLNHIAKPPIASGQTAGWAEQISKLADFPNVFCKVSGMVTEAGRQHWQLADFVPFVEHVLNSFGSERILFGSDWPVCLLAADYGQVKALFNNLVGFNPQTAEHNAKEVYRLTLEETP
jgi:L-fuconolactonase